MPPTPLSERRPRGGTHSRPLRMLSWNAGHLGVQQWAEVKAWLHTGASDSCDLLETHWNGTAEFTVEGWQCVSSAKKGAPRAPKGKAKPRQRRKPQQPAPQEETATTVEAQVDTSRADGVMLLLSPAIDKKTIRWKEHLKGRLIQASFSWHGARVHVLVAYQHVFSEKCTPKQGGQGQITGLIGLGATRHPRQGHAVAGGRLQRPAACQPELGRPLQHSQGKYGGQDESFQRFVESHRLTALNTGSSGRGHTYVQGDARTQIDYIFTFPNSSRGQAKQAKPAPQLGLGGWKKGGYIPILAAVRPVRHWNLRKESRNPPSYCASSLEAAVRAHSPQAQAMQTWVDSQLQSTALPPDSINNVLMQGAARFFPKRVSTVKPINAKHRATLRMWQRLQHINANTASPTLTDADSSLLKEDLATWHRQAVTLARKQRAREFQDEVEEACRQGDAYLAHKTLRKLRPWQPQTRAQLQSSEGSLLTPQEELTMLETHVTKIFAKYPQLNRTVHSLPDISGTLLGKHIGSIRPHKAVPTGSAPAAAWNLCAPSAGASLAAHLSSQAGHHPCPATEALEAPLKDADKARAAKVIPCPREARRAHKGPQTARADAHTTTAATTLSQIAPPVFRSRTYCGFCFFTVSTSFWFHHTYSKSHVPWRCPRKQWKQLFPARSNCAH